MKPHHLHRLPLPRRAVAGFSLVEVALAVAIAAVGIITCLGLLPEGLEMSRKTGQLAIHANILDQIVQDIDNASGWSTIKPNYKKPNGFPSSGSAATSRDMRKYYDYQGTQVEADSKTISFVSLVDFSQTCQLSGNQADQNFLARVIIRIATTPNPDFEFGDVDDDPKLAVSTYCHVVAKTR